MTSLKVIKLFQWSGLKIITSKNEPLLLRIKLPPRSRALIRILTVPQKGMELPTFLNTKLHHRVYNSPPLGTNLSQINP
jgi:hypothetical protein